MKHLYTRLSTIGIAIGLLTATVRAQPGSNDPTFNIGSGIEGGEVYVGVEALAQQPDGKLLVGGSFSTFNGTARNGIVRLNADGTIDPTFDPGAGCTGGIFFGYVSVIALQPDGRILLGGDFTAVNGVPRNFIARLDTDGNVDLSFDPGNGFNSVVMALAVRPDGKIIAGGDFGSFNGVPRHFITQLNADGTLDTTFDPGTGFPTLGSSEVDDLALESDGRVVVSGVFNSYDGTPVQNIVRLGTDAALDPSFTASVDGRVWAMQRQPDGKLLIGGEFLNANGVARARIARLEFDGGLDASFNPGSGFTSGPVFDLALAADSKVVAVGRFLECDGVPRARIARLHGQGALDSSFDPGAGFNDPVGQGVTAVVVQPSGELVAAGYFTTYNGNDRNRIARLHGGGVDCLGVPNGPALPGTACDDGLTTTGNDVYGPDCVCAGQLIDCQGVVGGAALPGTVCDDGNSGTTDDLYDATCVCVGTPPVGDCEGVPGGTALPGTACNDCNPTTFNDVYDVACICAGIPTTGTAYQASSLDPTFDPGSGFNGEAGNMALQPDGKAIVSGSFTAFDGTTRNHIARINADGSLDAGYATGTGFDGLRTSDPALQSDGKVFVSGEFTQYNGTPRNSIVRLKANGALDATFNPGTGFDPYSITTALALQPNGKVLVAGYFNSFNGAPAADLVRLNANGTIDPTFDIGLGFDYEAFAPGVQSGVPEVLQLQPDGRLLVVGGISWYDGLSPLVGDICRGIARLDQLGGFDHTFQYGDDWWDETEGFNGSPEAVVLLDDGRMYIGGDFTAYYGVERDRIIRLNADGTLDTTFVPGTGFNDEVTALAIQPDGRILVGGNFTSYQGVPRERIARLNADGSLDATFQPCEGFNGMVRDFALQPDGRLLVTGDFTAYGGVARNGIARLFTVDATCIASQLTATVDPVVSCGAVNLKFNGTSTIAATEVPGANKYQFHFTNIQGEPAYTRNIAFPTRSFTLTKWLTQPLKAGRTYNVTVRASFDDGTTWCDWGTSCTVKISWEPLVPGMPRGMEESAWEKEPALLVYPNPTNGDQLRIDLSGADPALATATLDLTDLFGKRVMTATLPLQDGEVDMVLTLNGDLATGLYILTITAGDQAFNERLVINR